VQQGTKGVNFIVVAAGVDAIAEDDYVHLPVQINPDRRSRKS
jgi:hypothetical protein